MTLGTQSSIGEHDGTHYIAMEFIDGQRLRELTHSVPTDLKASAREQELICDQLVTGTPRMRR